MKPIALLAIATVAFFCSTLRAQVPQLINYQGRVIAGNANFDGAGQFKFAFVNANGSQTFWSNDGTSNAGSEPAQAVSLAVAKGLYSVLLGDNSLANMTPISPAVFNNPDVRLRVWFNDGARGSQLLAPDQRIAAVGYAMTAANVPDGAITGAKIAAQAITGAKIAPGAVAAANLAPNSLDFSHLAVPNSPGAGQVLGFNGTSLNWVAPGSGGSVFSLNGTSAYYNGGNVGIGTSTPGTKLTVVTQSGSGPLQLGMEHTDGTVRLGTYAEPNEGGWLGTISNHPLNFFVNNGQPSMTIDTGGAVNMNGGGPGTVTVGTPNAETGLTIKRSPSTGRFAFLNRADVRFDGTTLKLVAAPGVDPPPTGNGIAIDTSGDVGIGTATPRHRLSIAGGPAWTSNGWGGAMELANAGAIGWQANSAGQRFGMGHTGGGFYIFRTASDPGTTASPASYDFAISDTGNVGIGVFSPAAKLDVNGTTRTKALTITGGADIAEPFQMKEPELEKGSVVVIDDEHPGRLKRSQRAYDTRVAGIVSGANGINAGIALQQEGAIEGGQNVALSGRVYVRADVSSGPIKPGNLLTTSDIPGHAMRVGDHGKAQGAVIGKAMSSLEEGEGMVLMLVSLQ